MDRYLYSQINRANYSSLKILLEKSPAHYRYALDNPEEEDPERFAVGKLAHSLVLDGKNLLDLYAIKPEGMSFAKKDGKEWRAAQTKPILTAEEAASIPAMAQAIADDETASKLLKLCPEREKVILGDIAKVGCKAMLDAFGADASRKPLIPDIKTCQDASPRGFGKQVMKLNYILQAALYSRITQNSLNLTEPPMFVWIAVENKPPHAVQCYQPTEQMWRYGFKQLERCLTLLMACRENSEWPSYGGGLIDLDLPDWCAREL